jgi:hypothetical protein
LQQDPIDLPVAEFVALIPNAEKRMRATFIPAFGGRGAAVIVAEGSSALNLSND